MGRLRASAYSKRLRDPRWQRRRLEIMQRDGFTCQACLSKEKTLNVHHRWYVADADPWDYPDIALVTLCEDCHSEETFLWDKAAGALVRALRRAGMTAGGLATIADAIGDRQLSFAEAETMAHRLADVVRPQPTGITVGIKGVD